MINSICCSSTIISPLLSISKVNASRGIEISVNPNRTFIPPGGIATSLIKVKANQSADLGPHTIGINSHISFPITFDATALSTELSRKTQQIPIFKSMSLDSKSTFSEPHNPGNLTLNTFNKGSAITPRPSYFSIIVSSYSLGERFKDFWETYGGIIGFVAGGFVAGFSALIIDRIKNKKNEH